MEKRSRFDRDGESSKSKKKHKKHKKHKKSKKHETDDKDRTSGKKHKKHRKRSPSSDDSSDANSNKSPVKTKTISLISSNKGDTGDIKLPPQSTTTLNTKFTEIMKSNGHIVVAKLPTAAAATTWSTSTRNGDSNNSERRPEKFKIEARVATTATNNSNRIPTDPNKLVEFITKSLDQNVSTQIVSSASESESIHDVDSPDVTVIEDLEDDLNLEELMRQKALLQARLG